MTTTTELIAADSCSCPPFVHFHLPWLLGDNLLECGNGFPRKLNPEIGSGLFAYFVIELFGINEFFGMVYMGSFSLSQCSIFGVI